ncbi:MAG: hypothetical protein IT453_18980 [Planctomycetes bacterium]|nr:hypothetical protein [Planctomycetota bacterium]
MAAALRERFANRDLMLGEHVEPTEERLRREVDLLLFLVFAFARVVVRFVVSVLVGFRVRVLVSCFVSVLVDLFVGVFIRVFIGVLRLCERGDRADAELLQHAVVVHPNRRREVLVELEEVVSLVATAAERHSIAHVRCSTEIADRSTVHRVTRALRCRRTRSASETTTRASSPPQR